MREVRRRRKPVVGSVDASHRDAREFFLRDALQATDVDAVHLSNGCLRSDTEWTDAAVLAEVVQVLARVEPVLGEFGFARQQPKVLRCRYRRPEPGSPADGAVAAIGILREVEFGLELDRS